MNLNDLIGQEIVTNDPILSATVTATRKCKYIVIEAFPYFVKGMRICDNGAEIVKCFNIGDLVTMGLIKAYMVPHKTGYRFARKGYEGKL